MTRSAHINPAIKRLLAGSLFLMAALPAWALQVIPVREGETLFAKIG